MKHDHTTIAINEITNASGQTVQKNVISLWQYYKSDSGAIYRLESGMTVKDLIQLDKALAPLRIQRN